MEEIWEEGQIRRSRKHRRRGLTKSQKLLSSPIDFFSNKPYYLTTADVVVAM
jgi:hypothetical protein